MIRIVHWLTDWRTDWLTVSSYGQNRAWLASCSQDPTFIQPIRLSSTLGTTSKPIFNPLRVLPKPFSTPLKYFQRQLASLGKVEHWEQTTANIQLLWNQLASLQPLGWLPMPIFNPLRVLPKPSPTTKKYFQWHLASMSKVKPCEHNSAKFQLLWNQLASFQPLGWLPLPIFNPIRVLPKPSSIPQKYFQTQLASMSKLEPSEHTKGKIQIVWNQLASLCPLGWLPMPISKPMRILPKHIFNQT